MRNGEKPGKAKKGSTKEDKKSREKSKSPVKSPTKKDVTPKKDREDKENKLERQNSKNRSPSTKAGKREPMRSPQKIVNGHTEGDNNSDLITNGLGCIPISALQCNDELIIYLQFYIHSINPADILMHVSERYSSGAERDGASDQRRGRGDSCHAHPRHAPAPPQDCRQTHNLQGQAEAAEEPQP